MPFEMIQMNDDSWRERLIRVIADRKIKRSVVCAELGWSRNYITMALNGTIEPTIEKIQRFCTHTGIDFASLFADTDRSDREIRVAEKLLALNAQELDYALRVISALRDDPGAD